MPLSSSLQILDGIRIASPCPASWESMIGDDRQRACAACGKDVYNLDRLTTAEALSLVSRPGEPACVRFYRRADGTVLTADCPVGLKAMRGGRILKALAVGVGMAITATFTLATATFRPAPEPADRTPPTPDTDPAPVPVTASLTPSAEIKALVTNWVDDALVKVGLRQRCVLLGDIDRSSLVPAPPIPTPVVVPPTRPPPARRPEPENARCPT